MAREEIIARRYARGLAEQAAGSDSVEAVRENLKILADVADSRSGSRFVPEFAHYLASPLATPDDKLAAVDGILAKLGVDETTASFFKLLVAKNRFALLPRIRDEFDEMAGRLTGEYTAVVETARPLTPDQENRLTLVLANALGGLVRVRQRIEPGLLAGARVKVGDKTFDGSVLGRLERLRGALSVPNHVELEKVNPEG